MTDKKQQIAELLLQTGNEHHTEYYGVDGDDPDWPLWYAEYLHGRLPPFLGKELTVSELTYLMVDLDRQFRAQESESEWNQFYAAKLLKRYPGRVVIEPGFENAETEFPSLTTEQMIEVDRAMIEDYEISLAQMMENAGRSLAHVARERFLKGNPGGKNVIVLAGTGGNGGGALVAARRLANYGANITVVTTLTAESYRDVPRRQLETLRHMAVPFRKAESLNNDQSDYDLLIDGIIGYNLSGAPRGDAAKMIRWANKGAAPVLALDVPSGIDATTGMAHDPSVKAAATVMLALPKIGLLEDGAAANVGELYLADITVPPGLYAEPQINLQVGHIFARNDIVRIR
jgi:NAD(P)H-hydrate epimerase